MKEFRVVCYETIMLETIVEAENESQAIEMIRDDDSGLVEQSSTGYGDYEVEEV